MLSNGERPVTPTISQVQEELAKFLQDFDTVKFLIDQPDEPQPSQPLTDSRRSVYDNVPPPPMSSNIPKVQVTDASPAKDTTDAGTEDPKPGTSQSNSTFPRPHQHYSSPKPLGQKTRPSNGTTVDNAPSNAWSSDTFPRRGHSNQSTTPTVRCSTCKEVLQSKENVVFYPAYCTMGHHHRHGESESSSNGLPSIDEGVWKTHQHPSHVRFKLEDSDKMPLRWGSSRIVPVKGGGTRSNRKRKACPTSVIVAVVLTIIGVCLLGIGVAVTCASLLSVLQDDVKDATTGCQIQAHHANMVVSWLYNTSCTAQLNLSLADVASTNFVRASKVYEALLDPVFRRGQNRDYFDFTKVERVWCLGESENNVFISFKIFWKDADHVPEPRLVLQDFLMSIKKLDQERYNISTYSVTIEGFRLSKS